MTRKLILWSPFMLVMGLLAMFLLGLRKGDDNIIASQMVGRSMPPFESLAIVPGQPAATAADFSDGKPRLLNIFASWCGPCRVEAPMLMALKRQGIEVDGIAVNDTAPEVTRFLAENGNPYARLGLDKDGRAQMAFGSSGVPETYVINGKGQILHQHVGIVTREDAVKLVAMLRVAQ